MLKWIPDNNYYEEGALIVRLLYSIMKTIIQKYFRRLTSNLLKWLMLILGIVVFLLGTVGAVKIGGFYIASIALVLAVLVIIVSYFAGSGASVKVRVLSLLGIYVGLMVAFGTVHYAAFLYRPDLYAFSDSIQEGKRVEEYSFIYEEALNRSKSLYVLALLHSNPEYAMQAKSKMVSLTNPSEGELDAEVGFVNLNFENRIRFLEVVYAGAKSVSIKKYVELRSGDFKQSIGGELIEAVFLPSNRAIIGMIEAENREEMLRAIEKLIEVLQNEREQLLTRVRGLITNHPDWGLFDFIYYSAVTLTTLGYGDIFPNSTITRWIVLFNSVFGVFFVGFSLISLWPEKD